MSPSVSFPQSFWNFSRNFLQFMKTFYREWNKLYSLYFNFCIDFISETNTFILYPCEEDNLARWIIIIMVIRSDAE